MGFSLGWNVPFSLHTPEVGRTLQDTPLLKEK